MNTEQLLERLRSIAARADAPPADVIAAARSSIAWRTLDAELAELTYDSVMDDAALAGVRSGEQPRHVTFESVGLTLELEIEVVDGVRRIVGQLVPPSAAEITIRHPDGDTEVAADDLGRFAAEAAGSGPMSLKIVLDDGAQTIETDWVVL